MDYSLAYCTDLVEVLKTDLALEKMLEVTQYVREQVPLKDRVIVAETINGRRDRRYRSGLIYLAYDLNKISVAKAFAELSLHFAIYVEYESGESERCQEASKLWKEIMLELGL